MTVSDSTVRPFDSVNGVGVAIMNNRGQRHSAFLYKTDDGPSQLVHLGWHLRLFRAGVGEQHGPDDRYMWADIAEIEAEDRRYLAGYLSTVGGPDPQIPYGLNAEGIEFDPVTGELMPHPNGHGLTCATFMVAVLRSVGYYVMESENWPVGRAGDAEWQAHIIEMLDEENSVHADAVRAILPSIRIRPEEVVGASSSAGWTHDFSSAAAAGKSVLTAMAAAGKL